MEEKIKKAFGFFLSVGGVIGIVSDVFTPVTNFAGALIVPLLALTLLYALAERAKLVERTLCAPNCPSAVKALLGEYRGFPLLSGLLVLTLMMVASSFITRAHADEGGVAASYIPGVRELQTSLDRIGMQLAELTSATRELKKETSDDPRKELSNMGIEWTSAAFHDAVVRGDFKALDLFIAGGMPLTTRKDGNPASPLYYALARNEPNRVAMLEYFLDRGLDVNDRSICVPEALGTRDCGNGTLLAIARAYLDEPAFDLLLARGADPQEIATAALRSTDYYRRSIDYYDSLRGREIDPAPVEACDRQFDQEMRKARLVDFLPRLTEDQVALIRRGAAYVCADINVQPEYGPNVGFGFITKVQAFDFLFLAKVELAGHSLPTSWDAVPLPHELPGAAPSAPTTPTGRSAGETSASPAAPLPTGILPSGSDPDVRPPLESWRSWSPYDALGIPEPSSTQAPASQEGEARPPVKFSDGIPKN